MVTGTISARIQLLSQQQTDPDRPALNAVRASRSNNNNIFKSNTISAGRRAGPNGVPTRGLAAGLISKFNQLAATPGNSDAATITAVRMQGRGSIARAFGQKDPSQKNEQRPPPINTCSTKSASDLDVRPPSSETTRSESPDCPQLDVCSTAISLKIDSGIEQLPSPAPSLSQAHSRPSNQAKGGDVVVCGEIFGAEGSPGGKTSPFLSDSEMDRALSEIEEFGRDMNLSLEDMDISQFDFEAFPYPP